MKINPDTKDALLFMTGLLGIVAQGVLWGFGIPPSLPLIGAYLTMCGVASLSSIFVEPRIDRPRDDDDVRRPTATRRRKKHSDRTDEQ